MLNLHLWSLTIWNWAENLSKEMQNTSKAILLSYIEWFLVAIRKRNFQEYLIRLFYFQFLWGCAHWGIFQRNCKRSKLLHVFVCLCYWFESGSLFQTKRRRRGRNVHTHTKTVNRRRQHSIENLLLCENVIIYVFFNIALRNITKNTLQ